MAGKSSQPGDPQAPVGPPTTGPALVGQPRKPRFTHQLKLVSRLALRDYRHEWVLSCCSVLALAAVLIPLLVLFGLKYGIIQNLLGPLVSNPLYREITPISSGHFGPAWFESMRERDDVAFVVPKTRSLAAIMNLRAAGEQAGRIITVELRPSGAGDPSLGQVEPPHGLRQVVLSPSAAVKLDVEPGDKVEGILTRTLNGEHDAVRLPMTVTGIAPAIAATRDTLFVSVELMNVVEDFLDGRAVPKLGWEGSKPRSANRTYPSFILFADSLADVKTLHHYLINQGINVRTHSNDIALVQTVNRNLSVVYWVIAILAIGGYCLSFGTQVWANVDRKQRDFSVLRLTGMRTTEIIWFPILHAGFTAVLAWGLACLVFLAVQAGLNSLFAESAAAAGGSICRLLPWHYFAALGLTLVAAGVAAILGGRRVAHLEPSLGLREG